jgi:hypothetical protein
MMPAIRVAKRLIHEKYSQRYSEFTKIGEGSFGGVFRAKDSQTGEMVSEQNRCCRTACISPIWRMGADIAIKVFEP